jgi:hypothetical protein
MKVCDKGHQPICFTPENKGGFLYSGCPLCAVLKEVDGYQREASDHAEREIKNVVFEGIQPS